MAVMERVDTFLEGFKNKLAQSLLANCFGRNFSNGNSAYNSSHVKACRSEFNGLNLTPALAGNNTLTSEIDSRRSSVRLAEKRMTLLDANDSRLTISTLRRSSTVKKVFKRAPALPLTTSEGNSKSKSSNIAYRKDLLYFLNHASQSQIQKLPSAGPKAGHNIITFRNLNGMLKDFETLKMVPVDLTFFVLYFLFGIG
uniref:Uncharacterized protein n=1 Tax=Daphnia galeata TaxID=27404 RepID=A0A8J2RR76_9CRUS|nr:unnamed protein product [Daphnia galeata]CAH0109323.1 unnamed protein product [Daphnia galeata]